MTLASAAQADDGSYDGSFAEAVTSGSPCDGVFAQTDYHTRHFLTGPSRHTSVLNFGNDTDDASFFDGVSLVGRLGGSNDLYYEKTLQKDGIGYEIVAEGLIDYEVVYLEFSVTARDAAGATLCDATATYSGFN